MPGEQSISKSNNNFLDTKTLFGKPLAASVIATTTSTITNSSESSSSSSSPALLELKKHKGNSKQKKEM